MQPPLLRMQTKLDEKEEKKQTATSVDEDVAKMGVELTLLKSFKDGGWNGKAKEIMAKYGKIYLGVTVVLSSVNYAVCYSLVNMVGPAHPDRLTLSFPAALLSAPEGRVPGRESPVSTGVITKARPPLPLTDRRSKRAAKYARS